MTRRTIFILIGAFIAVAVAVLTIRSVTRDKLTDLARVDLRPSRLLIQKVSFPALSQDGSRLLYFSRENSSRTGIYRVNLATKAEELFRLVPEVQGIDWSPDRNQVIVSLTYSEERLGNQGSRFRSDNAFTGALTVWVHDLSEDRLVQLPLGTSSTTWDTSGKKIYYHFLDLTTDKIISELSVRSPFDGNFQKLADVPAAASYTMLFLNETTLLLVPNLSDPGGMTTIYLFDTTTNQLKTLAENKITAASGFRGGSHVLYESAGKVHTWHILEWSSGQDTDLELPVETHYTFWISDRQFLIVERGRDKNDRLWLVDAQDLKRREITLRSDTPLHLDSVLPAVGKRLYFTSDGILYKLELP